MREGGTKKARQVGQKERGKQIKKEGKSEQRQLGWGGTGRRGGAGQSISEKWSARPLYSCIVGRFHMIGC